MISDVLRTRVEELAAKINGKVEESLGQLVLDVNFPYIIEALTAARNFAEVPCDFLHALTGMDLGEHFEVVYQLTSLRGPQRLCIKTKVERENPVIDSATRIWRGADFMERETFDMFGIQFKGHANLKRIYMWDDFEGHPLRKDYAVDSLEKRAVMRVRKEGE